MRKFCFAIAILAAMLGSLPSAAQRQRGYVKTKGVMSRAGVVKPGMRIAGAVISVKGMANPAVSKGAKGEFSFVAPGKIFQVLNVERDGFVISDPETLQQTYEVSSSTPLVLVMEDPMERRRELAEAKRSIRNTMNSQLRQREAEIDSLREANKISEEQRLQLMEQLQQRQEKSDGLINEMALHFVNTDYDMIDELNQRINAHILNGELDIADSLIQSKGDMDKRIEDLQNEREALAAERRQLEKREVANNMRGQDLATDLYNRHLIFAANYQNDSAFYCLEQRLKVDSTNVIWLLKAGMFAEEYLSDYAKAEHYYDLAEQHATLKGDSIGLLKALFNKGGLYNNVGTSQKAMEQFEKVQQLQQQLGDNASAVVASRTYQAMAILCSEKQQFNEAFDYLHKALQVDSLRWGMESEEVADVYINMGVIYSDIEESEKALECYRKAQAIYQKVSPEDEQAIARIYNGMGVEYKQLSQLSQAEECYEKAFDIYHRVYGDHHPSIATLCSNVALLAQAKGDYEKAHRYLDNAIKITTDISGENAVRLVSFYGNKAVAYYEEKKYAEAVEYFSKAIDVSVYHDGNDGSASILFPHLYMALTRIIQQNPTQQNIDKLRSFLSDKVVVAVVQNGSPASSQGLSGVCELLEFCGWTVDSNECVFDRIVEIGAQPKDMVLRCAGKLGSYHFEDRVGVQWQMRYVSQDERQQLLNEYHQWKKKH